MTTLSKLGTTTASKYEVANCIPHYRQYITYEGGRAQLLTPNFRSFGLMKKHNGANVSILLPVEPWLRDQLNMFETFAQQNINSPDHILSSDELVYKPLWKGERMYIRVAKWCNILQQNMQTGSYESVNISTPLGPGTYNVTIEVPYIYIGPHKNGENYSLTLRIVQIVYHPELNSPNLIQLTPPKPAGRQEDASTNAQAVQT